MSEMNLEQQATITKQGVGMKRSVTQVADTIKFELRKNLRKFIYLLIFVTVVFAGFLLIQLINENRGAAAPATSADYVQNYLIMIDLVIIVTASVSAGSIICEDFDKQTGNLLFPKIDKNRILLGRIIALYFINAISIIFFYFLVGITTYYKYSQLPSNYLGSMDWALIYLFAVFSFVTFFSSLFKSTGTTIIISILFLLIVFQIISQILNISGSTTEPLFLLSYYSNIITAWFDMPTNRFVTHNIPIGRGDRTLSYTSWATPSAEGAIIGLVLYSAILLIAAYLLYRRRQMKQ